MADSGDLLVTFFFFFFGTVRRGSGVEEVIIHTGTSEPCPYLEQHITCWLAGPDVELFMYVVACFF